MSIEKQNAQTELGACVDLAGTLESTNQKTPPKSITDFEILASKSTATEVQIAKVLTLLRQGPKTTIELRRHGVLMPAARVFELKRDHDCIINTELVSLYDDEGIRHRKCALYHLLQQVAPQASFDFGGAR
jgi:hypothetical protein